MYVEWDSGDYSARMRNEPPPPRHNVERRRNDFVSLCDAQHQAEPLQSAIFSQYRKNNNALQRPGKPLF